MNYIALLNRFWQLRREVTFSSTEADLYFYLLEISNGLNWKNPFQQSNKLIEATLNVSEKTLIAARNRLKQHGLLDFTPGVKRSPTTYRLEYVGEYTGKIPAHPGAIGELSGGESGGNTPDINKHKQKEEERAAVAAPSALVENDGEEGKSAAEKPKPASRTKKPKAAPDEVAALVLPHPGETFAACWATFRTGPKQAKKPLSAFTLMLSKLGKYPEDFAVVMLEAAIQGDWSGVENDGTARKFTEWQAQQASRPASHVSPAARPDFDPESLFYPSFQATEPEPLSHVA